MKGISKDLNEATKKAAESLEKNNPKKYLEAPFGGIFVSLDEPGENLKKKSELTKFREVGIERDGEFHFVIERLMGLC
jgi:hypothetical protein